MRLRRTALTLTCASAVLTACGTSVPVAVLPPTTSASATASPSPTASRPRNVPTIRSLSGTGDPDRILGDTPGNYPGRLDVTGTDPRTIHRQVRAAMVAEMKRILDGSDMRWARTEVLYGQREVRGRTMMRITYVAEIPRCVVDTKPLMTTQLTKLGYRTYETDDEYVDASRGDVDAVAGPIPKTYGRCEILLYTPYIDALLDPGQFPGNINNDLAGAPVQEYAPDPAGGAV